MEPVAGSPHAKLADWWNTTSSGIVTAASGVEELTALEDRYSIILPSEFRAYLLNSAPQSDPSLDNELTNWWPLARIKNVPDEYEHRINSAAIRERARACIFFADFSIWCWAWAICCDDSEYRGQIAVVGGEDRFVASSFSDFVVRYIADPLSRGLTP
jgi:hypothetical protein